MKLYELAMDATDSKVLSTEAVLQRNSFWFESKEEMEKYLKENLRKPYDLRR